VSAGRTFSNLIKKTFFLECEQKASTLPDSSQMNILLQPYTPELSVELSITNKPIQTSHDSTSDSKELKTNSSVSMKYIRRNSF